MSPTPWDEAPTHTKWIIKELQRHSHRLYKGQYLSIIRERYHYNIIRDTPTIQTLDTLFNLSNHIFIPFSLSCGWTVPKCRWWYTPWHGPCASAQKGKETWRVHSTWTHALLPTGYWLAHHVASSISLATWIPPGLDCTHNATQGRLCMHITFIRVWLNLKNYKKYLRGWIKGAVCAVLVIQHSYMNCSYGSCAVCF